MKKVHTYYLVAMGIIVCLCITLLIKLKSTKTELETAEDEISTLTQQLEEEKGKIDEISQKLGSQNDNLSDKVDNIQSYASDLESSISDLLREIRWAECDACTSTLWDIERKAKDVESDFESLQSEMNN